MTVLVSLIHGFKTKEFGLIGKLDHKILKGLVEPGIRDPKFSSSVL